MMKSRKCKQRRGATAVEFAMVFIPFILFFFSILEYGRYLMYENMMVNSAREGCRYALVHSQDATVVTDTTNKVKARMAGMEAHIPIFTVEVFPTNSPSANLNTLNPDDPITVRVQGTFKPLFPTLLYLPVSFPIKSSSIMTCEGN
jgi:Flp pilus assembly protein TadG